MASALMKRSVPMICQRCLLLMQPKVATHRLITTSAALYRNMKWRERENIARSNEYGPFADLPDWSYLDGRETPLRTGQLMRKEEQREIAKRIDLLAAEMTKAVTDHQDKIQSEEDQRIEIHARKLRQKGSKYKKHEKLYRVIP
ncbi:large ribosomal subunit protein mL52-like [Amphiura filiformis]|uniref:large ribosomal subunit protein mL52-like n=1 Tax=Amphiura filiformis TaxID=82378 RepID=UPI003B227304